MLRVITAKWALGFLIMPTILLQSQPKAYQSALSSLGYARTPQDSLSVYIRLAQLSRVFSLKNSIEWAEKAMNLAYRLKDTVALIKCYNLTASAYMFRANYDSAAARLEKALHLQTRKKDSIEIANTYSHFGYINRRQGNYSLASSYYKEALAIRQKLNDKGAISLSYNSLGDLYLEQDEYSKALYYYRKGIQLARQATDSMRLLSNLSDLARTYCLIDSLNNVEPLIREGIFISQVFGSSYKLPELYFTFALLNYKQGNTSKTLEYLEKVLSIAGQIDFTLSDINIYNEVSQLYWQLGKRNMAIQAALKGFEHATQHDNINLQLQIAYSLYEYHKTLSDYQKALYYYALYRDLKENADDKLQSLQLAELDSDFENKKSQQEYQLKIIESEQKLERHKWLLWTSLSLLAISMVFVIALAYSNKEKKRINEALVKLNEELNQERENVLALKKNLERTVEKRTEELKQTIDHLTEQNQDLQQFSYIISHNIRSPIARIAGLVDLIKIENASSGTISPEIITHLEKAVTSLDTVIRDLNKILSIRKGISQTKEMVLFQEVLEWVMLTLESEIKQTHAKIYPDFDRYPAVYSVKAYVQSIMYNLVSNAIKYRKNDEPPEVQVCSYRKNDYVCLEVRDNGIGIDLKSIDPYKIFGLYQRMHTHVEGKGLGLYLVKSQVEALNGKIEVESEPMKGTKFIVYFPAHTLVV